MGKSIREQLNLKIGKIKSKVHGSRLKSEEKKRAKLLEKETKLDAKLSKEAEIRESKKKTQKIQHRINMKKGKVPKGTKKSGKKKESFAEKLAKANKLFE